MEKLAAIVLVACAVGSIGACIGAAMTYADRRRPVDGKGAVFCGGLAVVFAFIAGTLI